ncbi:MAG: S8 family serine peptidase [Anaerolineales bacterium]|nr:S8 family serine peptidase [Anaerolineales bacterium]
MTLPHPQLRLIAITIAAFSLAVVLLLPAGLYAQDAAQGPGPIGDPNSTTSTPALADPVMQGVYWDTPPQTPTILRLGDRSEIIPGPDDPVRLIVLLDAAPLVTLVTRPKSDEMGSLNTATVATVDATAMRRQQEVLAAQQAQFVANAQAAGVEVQVNRNFVYLLNGVALSTKAGGIPTLRSLPGVTGVFPDYLVKADLKESVPLVGAPTVWQLHDADGLPVTGEGIDVAIIDTGIDYTHPDLGGCFGPTCRVRGGYDFWNNDADPFDDHNHGTHVAGIVAARGVFTGVAPGANLWAIKVLSGGGYGFSSTVIAGVERAADLDGDPLTVDPADVANMSLGGSGNPDDPKSLAVDAAVDAGVVMAVAAGNYGPYSGSIISPGTARKAITVAASDKEDHIAGFSSRGPIPGYPSVPKPDITAPGVAITSSIPTAQYAAYSGTSMAAPHVAGAAALLMQLHPDWPPHYIKSILMNSALDLGESIYAQGAGRLQVNKAATASMLVLPATSDLGSADADDPAWQISQPITVVNLLTSAATFSFTISATIPAGLIAELDEEAMTIEPGKSGVVHLNLRWAPDGVEAAAAALADGVLRGSVLVQQGAATSESRFALAVYGNLTIRVGDPADWVLVFNEDTQRLTRLLNPCCAFTLQLPFGAYDIVAAFPQAQSDDAAATVTTPAWVILEDVPLGRHHRVVIDRSQALHTVIFEPPAGGTTPAARTTLFTLLANLDSRVAIYDMRTYTYTAVALQYSDMSPAYQLEARTFARTFDKTFTWYEAYFKQTGLQSDLRLAQNVESLTRKVFEITSGVFDRAQEIERCVAIHWPDGATLPSQCETLVTTSGFPYVEARYMAPTPPDAMLRSTSYRLHGPLRTQSTPLLAAASEAGVPDAGSLPSDDPLPPPVIPILPSVEYWDALIGPDISVTENGQLRLFGTEHITVTQVFTTNSGHVPLGAPPPIWLGETKPYTTGVCFSVPRNGYDGIPTPFAMRSQAGSIMLYRYYTWYPSSIPFVLTREGTLIRSGSMSFPTTRSESCVYLPTPDAYSATFTYPRPYSVTGRAANVTAQLGFDTRRLNAACPDAEPPSLTALELMADGNLQTHAPPGKPFTILLGAADRGAECARVASVLLEYQTTTGWNAVPLQQVDGYYTGEMPALPAGQPLSLRVTVIDGEGNWLIYRAEPAFEVAPAPALPSETSFTFLPDVMNRR